MSPVTLGPPMTVVADALAVLPTPPVTLASLPARHVAAAGAEAGPVTAGIVVRTTADAGRRAGRGPKRERGIGLDRGQLALQRRNLTLQCGNNFL
jgi:hypothetical protein